MLDFYVWFVINLCDSGFVFNFVIVLNDSRILFDLIGGKSDRTFRYGRYSCFRHKWRKLFSQQVENFKRWTIRYGLEPWQNSQRLEIFKFYYVQQYSATCHNFRKLKFALSKHENPNLDFLFLLCRYSTIATSGNDRTSKYSLILKTKRRGVSSTPPAFIYSWQAFLGLLISLRLVLP